MSGSIENITKYFTDRDLSGDEIKKLIGKERRQTLVVPFQIFFLTKI